MENTIEVNEVLQIVSQMILLLRAYNMINEAAVIEDVFRDFAANSAGRAEPILRMMSHPGTFGDWGFSIPRLNTEYVDDLNRLKRSLRNLAREAKRSRVLEDPRVSEAWKLINENLNFLMRAGFTDRVNVLQDVFRDFLDAPRSYSRIALDQITDPNAFWHWTFEVQRGSDSSDLGGYHASMKRLEDLLAKIYEG